MNYWIITDTHFGHDRLCEYTFRPPGFESIICKNLEAIKTHGNILIHLGDICIGNDEKWHQVLNSLSKLVWRKRWLCKGNHDRKTDTWYLKHGWDFVADRIWLRKFGLDILLSHMPLEDCGYDVNIHGHCHSDMRVMEDEIVKVKNDKRVMISMEATNFMPVNLKSIHKLIKLQPLQ